MNQQVATQQEANSWPCHIKEADFKERTVTLEMDCDDFKVSAGPCWLSLEPRTGTAADAANPLTKEQEKLVDAAVGEIMDQAQVYASSWSLVGGPFDGGNGIENANDEKNILRTMVTSLARLAAQSVKEGGAA